MYVFKDSINFLMEVNKAQMYSNCQLGKSQEATTTVTPCLFVAKKRRDGFDGFT
jgi:hypothetical protein